MGKDGERSAKEEIKTVRLVKELPLEGDGLKGKKIPARVPGESLLGVGTPF